MSAGVDGLPGGWAATNLAALGDLVTGMTPSTKQEGFHGGGIPFVKPGDLDGDQPLMRSTDTVSEEGAAQGRLLPVDSVLVSCIGNLGKTAILGVPAISNQQINAIVPGPAVVPKYILHFCRTLRPWMDANASATTITILNKGRFGTAPVRVAPLNEQRRIVAKIEALQARAGAAKDALDAIPALLEKFRQSVLAAAFRGDLTREWREAHPDAEPAAKLLERIRAERKRRWVEANPKKAYVEPEPVDTAGLPELPGGWCWAGLNEVMRKITDGTHFTPEYVDAGVPFLSVKDLRKGLLHFDDCKFISKAEHAELFKRCDPELGDVLVTKSGTIGRVAVVRTERQFSLFVSVALLKPASPLVDPEWFAFAFEQWISTINVKSDVKGSAVKNLHLEDFRKLRFPLAPAEEQVFILGQLADRIAAIDATKERLVELQARVAPLTQSILSKAFRGELVPQDPNDEPASALLDRIRRERDGQGAPAAKRGRKPKGPTA